MGTHTTSSETGDVAQHAYAPAASFDGGSLDCGSGLLLLIRKHIDPLEPGQLLEIRSCEPSVREDLPAWCRLTGNALVSHVRGDTRDSYLVSKGPFGGPASELAGAARPARQEPRPAGFSASRRPAVSASPGLPVPASPGRAVPAPPILPLSVMGIGSWPRPRWMLAALHGYLEGRMSEEDFQATADDAVRLAVAAQERAGVDLVTDGEQRRDSYASFVGSRLDNCQLIPIGDLLPYVDDPEKFRDELEALDVPADVRHPAVFGPLVRRRPLAVHELRFVQSISERRVKVALPGPYLLTRTMWMECLSDRAYERRERLADDVVRVLREEVVELLAAGAAIVQFDEPVLTEVVYGGAAAARGDRQSARGAPARRSFMCGALGEKGAVADELDFAEGLINRVADGFPRERIAVHVCRGNWSPDERVALAGDYRPLVPLLSRLRVGTLFLELCTPRAGEMQVLAGLPDDRRIGVGVVNQKSPDIETAEEVLKRAEDALRLFGPERVLLNSDCGFATFADNPIASAEVAERKLAAMVEAARVLRRRHSGDRTAG